MEPSATKTYIFFVMQTDPREELSPDVKTEYVFLSQPFSRGVQLGWRRKLDAGHKL
jgi:hypothetical protein